LSKQGKAITVHTTKGVVSKHNKPLYTQTDSNTFCYSKDHNGPQQKTAHSLLSRITDLLKQVSFNCQNTSNITITNSGIKVHTDFQLWKNVCLHNGIIMTTKSTGSTMN